MIPTLIGITLLVFLLVAYSPGGIGASLKVAGGQMSATSRAIQEAYLDDRYGLNDSPLLQYARWMRRIVPIKFGPRDQVTPAGEVIQRPRPLSEPRAWAWYAAALPDRAPQTFIFPPDADSDQRARTYSRALDDYAQARAAYVTRGVDIDQAITTYVRAVDAPGAVNYKGKLNNSVLARLAPDPSRPEFAAVNAAGDQLIAAYTDALDKRAALDAIFLARPHAQAGIPLIPGILGLGWPDLGTSFSKQRPVVTLIKEALPVTLLLNLIAVPIIYLVAVPMGMLAATKQRSLFDVLSGALFVALWSVPVVWAGVLAIGFLANKKYLGWFPVSGLHDNAADAYTWLPMVDAAGVWRSGYVLDTLWHIALPVACLVYTGFAVLSKLTRASMLDNFNADYVRTAKAKGVSSRDVVLRHVFRNSLLPIITVFVLIFPAMLSGSVVIEKIFSIPGMGSLIISAIDGRDRELLLANTLMIAAVDVFAILLADILYAMADPRISFE